MTRHITTPARQAVPPDLVAAIRRRLRRRGLSVREWARQAGVSASFLFGLLGGEHRRTRHLEALLEPLGLTGATRDDLAVEARVEQRIHDAIHCNDRELLRRVDRVLAEFAERDWTGVQSDE